MTGTELRDQLRSYGEFLEAEAEGFELDAVEVPTRPRWSRRRRFAVAAVAVVVVAVGWSARSAVVDGAYIVADSVGLLAPVSPEGRALLGSDGGEPIPARQARILADGVVLPAEYDDAAARAASCMFDSGEPGSIDVVTRFVDSPHPGSTGDWRVFVGDPDDQAAVDDCLERHFTAVGEAWDRQWEENTTRRLAALQACLASYDLAELDPVVSPLEGWAILDDYVQGLSDGDPGYACNHLADVDLAEPAGIDLDRWRDPARAPESQRRALLDGVVTDDEYEAAASRYEACMAEWGLIGQAGADEFEGGINGGYGQAFPETPYLANLWHRVLGSVRAPNCAEAHLERVDSLHWDRQGPLLPDGRPAVWEIDQCLGLLPDGIDGGQPGSYRSVEAALERVGYLGADGAAARECLQSIGGP